MTVLRNEQSAISGHVIPNLRVAEWENIIEEWALLIDRYCRVTEGDAPYWYTERANVGVLAGACWRAGYVALEEFQYQKGFRNKPKWKGRADLWFGSKTVNSLIEAKLTLVSLNTKDVSKRLLPILNLACSDAKKTKASQSDLTALGMVFVPVYLPRSSASNISEKIEQLLSDVKKEFSGSMIFWHFPSATRAYLGPTEKNYQPGLFVIASEV